MHYSQFHLRANDVFSCNTFVSVIAQKIIFHLNILSFRWQLLFPLLWLTRCSFKALLALVVGFGF